MSYFGYASDLLEHIASECEATATIHAEPVRTAMLYLAANLSELAPLYEAICKYGMDDDANDVDVALSFRNILNSRSEDN